MNNVMLNAVKHLYWLNKILPHFVRQNDRSQLYLWAHDYFLCFF
jgi:hypothetical protein